jgi:hypothetical protein
MRFEMGDQPPLLTVAVGVCLIVFIGSFCTAFFATLLIFSRTGALVDRADERELSWGERAGRKMNRWNDFLVADEYKSLRRLYFSAWAGALGSFGLISLLMAVFGKPA